MTSSVHVASPSTSFKALVRLLDENRISAIPIVDRQGIPVGVVSEADLLLKLERRKAAPWADLLEVRRHQLARDKAHGRVASDVMTSPPITVRSDSALGAAARLIRERKVRRLVVVDERGKIAGILARSDLLQVFLRTDEELRDEIVEALIPSLMVDQEDAILVDVHDSVVTLGGVVDRKSDAEILGRTTSEVDGVVDVSNELDFRWDDSAGMPADSALRDS
ncbi:MAG TPA: CBS domain-containing protein [Candidatus Dormibacteraeota bacterium]|nr:CBS domain-containing protein [Candidatus Dormibacteraeota bacterium]